MKKMMKALVLVIALCLVLTGCQYLPEIPGLNQNPEHVHTLIHNAEKAPTCVNNGILEHWYCPGCNARFSDEAATTEVTFADLEVEETGHVAGADDGDCTTAVDCTVCGKVATPAAKAHTPEKDDGDCTTNVMCTQCAKIAVPAKAEHEANEDDGDCTTAVTCKHCDHVFVPAAEAHEAGEDDGDCTTAVTCKNCTVVTTEAAEAHSFGENEPSCTVCGTANPDYIPPVVFGTLAEFTFGANSSAAHVDGSDYGTSKSFTANGYTLQLTSMSKVFGPAYDAKGNSCIKLGTSSKTGTFKFTVPEDVTEVVIYVAKYKTNTTKITVNGTAYTINGASNNGVYDAIKIDTTTTKTITFSTVSGGVRCMINAIEFKGYSA